MLSPCGKQSVYLKLMFLQGIEKDTIFEGTWSHDERRTPYLKVLVHGVMTKFFDENWFIWSILV